MTTSQTGPEVSWTWMRDNYYQQYYDAFRGLLQAFILADFEIYCFLEEEEYEDGINNGQNWIQKWVQSLYFNCSEGVARNFGTFLRLGEELYDLEHHGQDSLISIKESTHSYEEARAELRDLLGGIIISCIEEDLNCIFDKYFDVNFDEDRKSSVEAISRHTDIETQYRGFDKFFSYPGPTPEYEW